MRLQGAVNLKLAWPQTTIPYVDMEWSELFHAMHGIVLTFAGQFDSIAVAMNDIPRLYEDIDCLALEGPFAVPARTLLSQLP